MSRRTIIAVIGGSSCTRDEADLAERVGRLLARRGAVVLTGGRGGVMEAASRGAVGEGGLTLGLLPGTTAEAANPFVDLALPTGLGDARNAIVAQACQAVIAIGGGPGTLSEIALAIKAGRTVVGLRTWTAQDGTGARVPVVVVETPEAAVTLALEAAGAQNRGQEVYGRRSI